jgi:hypothetical protein
MTEAQALMLIMETIEGDEFKIDTLTQIYIATSSDELSRLCEDYRNNIGALDELI